jgi:hypothetical protein
MGWDGMFLEGQKGMKIFWVILSLLFLNAIPSWAKVTIEETQPLEMLEDNVTPKISMAEISKVLPTDIKQGENQNRILSKIADRGFQYWFNSSQMRDVGLIRVAHQTQEKLKTDVVLPSDDPLGVKHKISFNFEVFQAMAKLEYSGWVRAAASYDAKSASADISLKEKISSTKDIFLTHKANRNQDLSMVGVSWSF